MNRNTLSFAILLGSGTGSFAAPIAFPTVAAPFAIAVGDFNEDGNVDAAVSTFSGVSIYAGNGAGSFGAPLHFLAGDTPWSIAVADLNNDGNLDLAVANAGSDNVSILLGTGTGVFSLPVNLPSATRRARSPRAISTATR